MSKNVKHHDSPAPRKYDLEKILCEAIAKHLRVTLRYEGDFADRIFDPYAVYHTPTDKVCVAGTQISNPAKPQEGITPHNLEVGKITSIQLTAEIFQVDARFNRHDRKFDHGIICAI